jgi:hypothetical protein
MGGQIKVVCNTTFYVERAEQAGYIQELYGNLHSLIDAGTSEFETTTERIEPNIEIGPRICEFCENRAMHHRTICEECESRIIEQASIEHINSHY